MELLSNRVYDEDSAYYKNRKEYADTFGLTVAELDNCEKNFEYYVTGKDYCGPSVATLHCGENCNRKCYAHDCRYGKGCLPYFYAPIPDRKLSDDLDALPENQKTWVSRGASGYFKVKNFFVDDIPSFISNVPQRIMTGKRKVPISHQKGWKRPSTVAGYISDRPFKRVTIRKRKLKLVHGGEQGYVRPYHWLRKKYSRKRRFYKRRRYGYKHSGS